MTSSQGCAAGVTVKGLCQIAGFTRQAYYKERRARERERIEETVVLDLVRAQRRIHPRIGARKLLRLLAGDFAALGVELGRDRFLALLGSHGLLIKRRRRSARTTDSRHGLGVHPNRIRQIEPSMPNQVWVSDLTYVRTGEGFLFLSLITDAYSRTIVGYELNDRLETEGCLRALRMALKGLSPGAAPIHHSDRGTQYCRHDYVRALRQRGLLISMTEDNHCYENAQAERVNGILKTEYGLGETFRTKQQAVAAARQSIAIYNELRPHLALDYRTPWSVHWASEN